VPEFSEAFDQRGATEGDHFPLSQDEINQRGKAWISRIRRKRVLTLLEDEGMGIQHHETSADHQKIPSLLLNALPQGIREGKLDAGFGVGGGTGIGKTQAIAALVIKALTEGTKALEPDPSDLWRFHGKRPPSICCWSCWQSELPWLRSHMTHGAQERVDRLASAAVLILDDLGRERMKSDNCQDWGVSQLDYIVNTRYRMDLPTIWTTNIREVDLFRLYGAPLVRRLIEPNPLIWVEGLKPFH
jgi:hypothetical protein